MSHSKSSHPRIKPAARHEADGSPAPSDTVSPYDQDEWASKLAAARARRDDVLRARGLAGSPLSLVRPDARPPAALSEAGASVRTRPGSDADPQNRERPGAESPRTGPGASPLAAASDRIAAGAPSVSAERPLGLSAASSDTDQSGRRAGLQILAAFAMGLGVGIPLAGLGWVYVQGSDGRGGATDAALHTTALDASPAPAGTQTIPNLGADSDAAQATTAPVPGPPGLDAGIPEDLLATPPLRTAPAGQSSPRLAAVHAPPVEAENVSLSGYDTGSVDDLAQPAALPSGDRAPVRSPTVTPHDADAAPAVNTQAAVAAALAELDTPADIPLAARPVNRPDIAALDPTASGPPVPPPSIAPDVQVHTYIPRHVPAATIEAIEKDLQTTGATLLDPVRTGLTIQQTHIRYYHEDDAAAAEILAARISAVARDFTAFSPSPPDGMLEIWVAGRGGATTRSSSARTPDPIGETARGIGQAISRFLSSIPPSDPQ